MSSSKAQTSKSIVTNAQIREAHRHLECIFEKNPNGKLYNLPRGSDDFDPDRDQLIIKMFMAYQDFLKRNPGLCDKQEQVKKLLEERVQIEGELERLCAELLDDSQRSASETDRMIELHSGWLKKSVRMHMLYIHLLAETKNFLEEAHHIAKADLEENHYYAQMRSTMVE